MKERIVIVLTALLFYTIGYAGSISTSNIIIKPGELEPLMISLSSDAKSKVGVQFDLILPEGISLEKIGNDYCSLSSIQAGDLSCNLQDLGSGKYRFIAYSKSLKHLKVGELVSIKLKASSGLSPGKYPISLSDISFSDMNGIISKEDVFQAAIIVVDTRYMSIDNMTLKKGETESLTISLSGEASTFVGVQFDLSLPDGISLEKNGSELYSVSKNQASDINCDVQDLEDGKYRFVVFSKSLQPLKTGELISVTITANNSLPLTTTYITISEIYFADSEGSITKEGATEATVKVTEFFTLLYQVDGETYKSYEIEYETAIIPEAEPSKEGYSFSGWSEIPSVMPSHDVTITGTFTANKYKLTYTINGETYKEYEIDYGAITIEEDPLVKDGYTFSGWSYIPSKMPAEDVKVVGTFTVNKYKLTYIVDGELYKSYDVEYGTAITSEVEPVKEGYTFSGWSYIPSKMPAEDVTVIGTFIQTAIEGIQAPEETTRIYDMQGNRLGKLQKGVNIIRQADGKVRKVVFK